jgi:hypothetical protein
MSSSSTIAITSAGSSYSLPYDFKDVYGLRITTSGREQTLVGVPRSVYDRSNQMQTGNTGPVVGYDLYNVGALGQVTFHPAPSVSDSTRLLYYRRMWVPCTVVSATFNCSNVGVDSNLAYSATLGGFAGITNGTPFDPTAGAKWALASGVAYATAILTSPLTMTVSGATYVATGAGAASAAFGGDLWTLDIPEDYENALMSRATQEFLSSLGAPQGRLEYYIQLANDEFQEARAANERFEDQDISFELGALARVS